MTTIWVLRKPNPGRQGRAEGRSAFRRFALPVDKSGGRKKENKMRSPNEHYDVVLANGRVIHPETYLDGKFNVGIKGDEIAAITTTTLKMMCMSFLPTRRA